MNLNMKEIKMANSQNMYESKATCKAQIRFLSFANFPGEVLDSSKILGSKCRQ